MESITMAHGGCIGACCPIYSGGNQLIGHIIQRQGQQPILGTVGQFCAAFYHVHEWGDPHHYCCLDINNCLIGIRTNNENNLRLQPKQVIGVVKFEDNQGNTLYEARYSNCEPKQMHAEDFFSYDVQNGVLAAKIAENNNGGTITLYLTYQPCNKSVSLVGTKGTPPNKSCCETLVQIYNIILRPRNISLHIKATHLYRFEPAIMDHKILHQRAVQGVWNLLEINNGIVEHMTREDWNYLFSLIAFDILQVDKQRQNLDQYIQQKLVPPYMTILRSGMQNL